MREESQKDDRRGRWAEGQGQKAEEQRGEDGEASVAYLLPFTIQLPPFSLIHSRTSEREFRPCQLVRASPHVDRTVT